MTMLAILMTLNVFLIKSNTFMNLILRDMILLDKFHIAYIKARLENLYSLYIKLLQSLLCLFDINNNTSECMYVWRKS